MPRLKVYIAGPMQGYPEHNYPAFFEAEELLTELGYEVFNPAKLHNPDDPKATWEFCLKDDLKLVVDCNMVVLLPGWQLSRGAQLEKYVADQLKIDCLELGEFIGRAFGRGTDLVTKQCATVPTTQSFDLLFHEAVEWQNATFGIRSNPMPPLYHLQKEISEELLADPYNVMEYADCFLLLFNAASLAHLSPQRLLQAVRQKLEINKARTWGKPDADGVVEHVKEVV